MSTTCLIQEIQIVENAAQRSVESYESTVDNLLDKINDYRSRLEGLNQDMVILNQKIENTVCDQEEAQMVLYKARKLVQKFKILFTMAKKSKLYKGYKTNLHDLVFTVNDFEEYMQDFKFRHDKEAQDEIDGMLKGFTLNV